MNIVISQPMYLPWAGLFEQLKLADIFVHYDDAQFTKGGFLNRVQVKTADGFSWLTVPVLYHSGASMSDTQIETTSAWQKKHFATLQNVLSGLPHAEWVLEEMKPLLFASYPSIAALNIALFEKMAIMIGLKKRFLLSSEMDVSGTSSEKVLNLVKALNGTRYITGLGARNYLDHEGLEKEGIRIEYMQYDPTPYAQKFGAFNPYVTALSLLASAGPEKAIDYLTSQTMYWRDYVNQ